MGNFDWKIPQMIDDLRRIRDEIDGAIRHLEAAGHLTSGQTVAATDKKEAAEWVEELLRDLGNPPSHYREIAAQIIHRGYRGLPREGEKVGSEQHVERIARSLSGTLNRKTETFEGLGEGRYRLKNFRGS
jgi:hypothetical protein